MTGVDRLGVLDWGIGGLDVLRKLRANGDLRPALYLSDAGSVPYGKLSAPDLSARVIQAVTWLRSGGCRTVVVGCNAASTVLTAPSVRGAMAEVGCAVHGVIDVALEAVLRGASSDDLHVLIIGGQRTIDSDAHRTAFRARSTKPLHIDTRVAQPLSALIEAGVLRGPRLEACLAQIFDGVSDATTLVSACTHYVAVEDAMRRCLPRLERFIDPAQLLADALCSAPQSVDPERSKAAPKEVQDRFVTTGDPEASRRAAKAAFGVEAVFEGTPRDLRVLPPRL